VRGYFSSSDRSIWRTPVQVLDDIVVPDADHSISEGAWLAVASPVCWVSRALAAVEFDY